MNCTVQKKGEMNEDIVNTEVGGGFGSFFLFMKGDLGILYYTPIFLHSRLVNSVPA